MKIYKPKKRKYFMMKILIAISFYVKSRLNCSRVYNYLDEESKNKIDIWLGLRPAMVLMLMLMIFCFKMFNL